MDDRKQPDRIDDAVQPLPITSKLARKPSGNPKADLRQYFMLAHGSHLVDTARFLCGEITAVRARLNERFGAYCWFVETDGSGHHGYAAQDASVDSISPQGGGLFPTRGDFEAALGKLQIQRLAAGRPKTTLESVEYPGKVPTGWKIRALTATELKQLRGY